jgi:thiopeptide-type bacteriocin biosynthesis protein
MTDETASARWTSLHVFLADPGKSERWLTEILLPLTRDWRGQGIINSWFFIRYWEGGPHLRLRLRGLAPEHLPAVMAQLGQDLGSYLSAQPVSRETYYAGHSFDGLPVDDSSLPWFTEGSLVEIPYEPEFVRYGGTAAMAASEDLFAVSSQLTASMIAATPGNMDARLQRAALIMAVAINAAGFAGADAVNFASQHVAMWSNYSASTRNQARELALLAENKADAQQRSDRIFAQAGQVGGPGGPLAPFAQAVSHWRSLMTKLGEQGLLVEPFSGQAVDSPARITSAVRQILGSQLHMTCNRLGLSPHLEMAVASHLAGAALTETYGKELA